MEYDLFISHASEDKAEFVEPLVGRLRAEGLKVWYDRFELRLGDSLREKIDQGLVNCRYGLVVLSPHFFAKPWPKSELDGLIARQNGQGKKVILPIWRDVGFNEVQQFSPVLAGKLAVSTSLGMDAVVAQVLDAIRDEAVHHESVFQTGAVPGLREQCLDILRDGDMLAWRELLDQWTDPIPGRLKEWKQQVGDRAAHLEEKEKEDAFLRAVEICLPGFIPIVAAVEAGKEEHWRESLGLIRRLAILQDEMGGGAESAINVGESLLYVVGYLGLPMAVKTRQLEFVSTWMKMRFPVRDVGNESPWLSLYSAHHYPHGLRYNPSGVFKLLQRAVELREMTPFFPNAERFVEYAFMANLLSSLVELRERIGDADRRASLMVASNRMGVSVWPTWIVMNHREFNIAALTLLGSSQTVINFTAPRTGMRPEEFWPLWKRWKQVCAQEWDHDYGRMAHRIRWKQLPGEPLDESY